MLNPAQILVVIALNQKTIKKEESENGEVYNTLRNPFKTRRGNVKDYILNYY